MDSNVIGVLIVVGLIVGFIAYSRNKKSRTGGSTSPTGPTRPEDGPSIPTKPK